MTQAVLLGQADLAAGYKMHDRMSPEKRRIQLGVENKQQKSDAQEQKRTDVKIWTKNRWAVIVEGRKIGKTYPDVERLCSG